MSHWTLLASAQEAARPDLSIPTVTAHPYYHPETQGRTGALLSLVQKHKKVVIFSPAALVGGGYADFIKRAGVPVLEFANDFAEFVRWQNLEEFNAKEFGVLLASSSLNFGWETKADCLVLSEMKLWPGTPDLVQLVNRVDSPSEIHIINCKVLDALVPDSVTYEELFSLRVK